MARKARVSEATVSRALSDSSLIPIGTKERVRRAAAELGYYPNRQAALFAKRKTFRLGLVVPVHHAFPPFSRAYFPAVLDGVVLAAESKGYAVTIIPDHIDGKPKDLAPIVQRREVDGLVLAINRIADQHIPELRAKGIRFVAINGRFPGCDYVDNNPTQGMRQALVYLRDLGHKRVGFITGNAEYSNAMDRLEAFETLSNEFGMEAVLQEGDFSRRSGYYGAAKLLRQARPPTAIIGSTDRQIIGTLDYCKDHKIGVPTQVSLIGYDNLESASMVAPPLTTINNPIREIGGEAATMLIDRIETGQGGPKSKTLDTQLIVRQSTGPCPKGATNT